MAIIAFAMLGSVFAQERVHVASHLKNYEIKTPLLRPERDYVREQVAENPYVSNPNKNFPSNTIGTTGYDLQSNKSIDTRIVLYPDNTIGAAWTYGTGTGFTNRGTGYNYFSGNSWAPAPTARIESVRTGWGSYASFNAGEIVIAHDAVQHLVMNTRPAKGTGSWTESIITAPTGTELTWPRVVTVGDTIHLLSVSYINYESMENPIIYSRSVNAGASWTHQILPGMNFAAGQHGYSADIYAWAKPKNGNLAFIVGNMWHDVYIMKSTDGGNTWNKITIFQHPNPFTFHTQTSLDTTYVCDGLLSVEFDNNNMLHATFGVVRVMVEDPTTEQFSWFPFTSYLAYWNETKGTLNTLDDIAMEAIGGVIGWLMDLNGDGSLFVDFIDYGQLANYGNHGMVSQPQLTIDNDGKIFVIFAHVNENMIVNKYYRHIWGRGSNDGGNTWLDPVELTGGIDYEFWECVFGAMAKNSNADLHLIFQMDEQPGISVYDPPDHSQTTNYIVYMKVPKIYITNIEEIDFSEHNSINTVNLYPNPAADYVTASIISPVQLSAVINISNILGQTIYTEKINVKAGINRTIINLENIPAGIYIVNVDAKNFRNAQKLIVE